MQGPGRGFHSGLAELWPHGWQVGRDREPRPGDAVLPPETIEQVRRDPRYRLMDRPDLQAIADQLLRRPTDMRLQRRFQQGLAEQAEKYRMTNHRAFYAYFPPAGLTPSAPGWIPYLAPPIGGVLRVPVQALTLGVMLLGPTGSGKTTWLGLMLRALAAQPGCLSIAFDLKGDLVDSPVLAQPGLSVRVLHWTELMIALMRSGGSQHSARDRCRQRRVPDQRGAGPRGPGQADSRRSGSDRPAQHLATCGHPAGPEATQAAGHA